MESASERPALIRTCFALLGISGAPAEQEVLAAIHETREVFESELLMALIAGSAKDQVRILKKLVGYLDKATSALLELPPEILVAIMDLASREAAVKGRELRETDIDLEYLAAGARRFLAAYEPPKGRPANYALQASLSIALSAFEKASGVDALVSDNKHVDAVPVPASDTSRALVKLFRSFEPPPSQTAILNMIRKIKAEPQEASTPLDAVIRAHFDELDASLLPGRAKRD